MSPLTCLWCCTPSSISWTWPAQWRFSPQLCITSRIPVSAAACGSLKCLILTLSFFIPATKAFEITTTGAEPKVLSEQGIIVGSQIPYKEAHERLEEFDVLVILGGNSAEILEKEDQPFA